MLMIAAEGKNDLFIRDFIPKVSRTFALAIKFLPRALRDSVFTSYLLCRVADTLEDSPFLEADEKAKRLIQLSTVLDRASQGRRFSKSEISHLRDSIDPRSGEDHRLLAQSSKLFDILETLPATHKPIIYRWAGVMAGGMAEYTRLNYIDGENIGALKDVEDWDRYCYFVAGTVGHMLTELFIEHYDFDIKRAAELSRLGNSFGLGLQKVNVIKDVPEDRKRGVCYLPLDMMARHGLKPSLLRDGLKSTGVKSLVEELLNNATAHLDDAISYTALIPHGYRGLRMFLLVPVFLAVETLNLIMEKPAQSMAGPPVKLDRRDVSRVVRAVALRASANKSINEYYRKISSRKR